MPLIRVSGREQPLFKRWDEQRKVGTLSQLVDQVGFVGCVVAGDLEYGVDILIGDDGVADRHRHVDHSEQHVDAVELLLRVR